MIVFLDFDGVLNSNMFFNNRTKFKEDGTLYRDHSESLLPFMDETWVKNQPEEASRGKIISFYKNICYTNYKNLLKLLDKLDNPEIVLSTSWRHGFSTESWNVLFSKLPGWKYKIIGKTGTNPDAGKKNEIKTGIVKHITIAEVMSSEWSRYEEIMQYVLKHANDSKYFPDFIILDDDNIFGVRNVFKESEKHFFRTRRWSGLTNKDIRKITKYIGGKYGI